MRYLLDLQHWLLIFGGWAFADGFGRYNILNFGSSNAISGPATRCSKGQQCSRLGYIAASYGNFDDDYDYDDYDGSEYMNDYERDLDADENEYFDDDDALDRVMRQREGWRQTNSFSKRYPDTAPSPFRFPWQKGRYRDDKRNAVGLSKDKRDVRSRRMPAPTRKRKFSGGQELTGFWLGLRDFYDAIFWYDIDFEDNPYSSGERFDERKYLRSKYETWGRYDDADGYTENSDIESDESYLPDEEEDRANYKSYNVPRTARATEGMQSPPVKVPPAPPPVVARTSTLPPRVSWSNPTALPQKPVERSRSRPQTAFGDRRRGLEGSERQDDYRNTVEAARNDPTRSYPRQMREGGSRRPLAQQQQERVDRRSLDPYDAIAAKLKETRRRRVVVDKRIQDLEDKLDECEEKLSILDVSVQVWRRRLDEALRKEMQDGWPGYENGLVVTCRKRLGDLERQRRRGETVADRIDEEIEDSVDLLRELTSRAKALEVRLPPEMRKENENRMPEEIYKEEQNEEELMEEQSERKEDEFFGNHDEEKPQQDEIDDADGILGETLNDEHVLFAPESESFDEVPLVLEKPSSSSSLVSPALSASSYLTSLESGRNEALSTSNDAGEEQYSINSKNTKEAVSAALEDLREVLNSGPDSDFMDARPEDESSML